VAKAFTFEIKGLKELEKKFQQMPKQLHEEIDGEIETSCQQIVLKAKQDTRKDKGGIMQGISFSGLNLKYVIVSTKHYSPYHDFGTGSKVSVPAEVSSYAAQFKGRGIRKVNITPKPFFFSNFFLERPKLLANINNVIKRITK
jgi:hypothetical protein